jgi:hypothetical protein
MLDSKATYAAHAGGSHELSRQEQSERMIKHFDELAKCDEKTAIKVLQRAGILDKNGDLAKMYRSAE